MWGGDVLVVVEDGEFDWRGRDWWHCVVWGGWLLDWDIRGRVGLKGRAKGGT